MRWTAGLRVLLLPTVYLVAKRVLLVLLAGVILPRAALAENDGSVLPFSPAPSASVAEPRLQDSTHKRRAEQSHLPKDAPNILIILLDDVGFGLADTYGGPIHTPTLSRIAGQGISYNTFHTTSICSPTLNSFLLHQKITVDRPFITIPPRHMRGSAARYPSAIRMDVNALSRNGHNCPPPA